MTTATPLLRPVPARLGPMWALTIRQPWCACILTGRGRKNVENRTWSTTMRGWIALHAGQRPDPLGMNDPRVRTALTGIANGSCWTQHKEQGLAAPWEVRSKIVGIAYLEDVHRARGGKCTTKCEHWGHDHGFHLMLSNVHRLQEPLPMSGNQRFWSADLTGVRLAG
jgi:hypothetical protein